MGVIKHSAIVVTGYEEAIKHAYHKALHVFTDAFPSLTKGILVSEIVKGVKNGTHSFFIAPDGSKEGWESSNRGDVAREKFVEWLKETNEVYFVEVMFGEDCNNACIVNENL